jgi:hypothetical protein
VRSRRAVPVPVRLLKSKRYLSILIRTRRGLKSVLEVGTSDPLEVKRKRFSPVGPRSVDLVTGLSSPLLCAPARRPAHLLGCSASPRRAACLAACVGAPLDSLSLCTPAACTSGAGVPTRGTSHWGHPLRVERSPSPPTWEDKSSAGSSRSSSSSSSSSGSSRSGGSDSAGRKKDVKALKLESQAEWPIFWASLQEYKAEMQRL